MDLEPGEPTVVEEKSFCYLVYDLQGLRSPVTVILAFCHIQVRITA